MPTSPEQPVSPPTSAAVLVAPDVLRRMGRIVRHLSVGMIDQAIGLRILSTDPQIEAFALGPVQTIVHQPLQWPRKRKRYQQVVDVLSHAPPTVFHAMSWESYQLAADLAAALESEFVLQVSSLADCHWLSQHHIQGAGAIIATSQPLIDVLVQEAQLPASSMELIRPGLMAQPEITCFLRPDRAVTMLCTTDLEPGSGVDQLIESMQMLKQSGLESMLLFLLGRGSQEGALRALVRTLDLTAMVTFSRPMGDLSPALKSADVYINPTEETALTIGGLTAMAEGVAVVVKPNPACDHYVDGETVIVAKEPTPASLAAAMERVVGDKAYAQGLARGGLEYARAHHAMSRMAEQTAAIYRRIALQHATIPLQKHA